jgi:glucose-6-phosphate dehydrogenase assembly protein OpcA
MTASPVAEPSWVPSTPAAIEEDLRGLWEAAARQSPVSRALMSNLIIVTGGAGSAEDAEHEAEQLLSSVARRHPARVVILDHRCTSHAREPQSVRVGLLTIGPPDHRYGIEIISVAVACLDESLPSILRAITCGDVPTTIWLTGDLSVATPAMPLIEISRQMIYDSGRWKDLPRGFQGVAGLLDAAHPAAPVDLAWRRLAPLRRAVATALEPLRYSQRPRPEQTTITAAAGREPEAWLLWGWLRIKLGWSTTAAPAIVLNDSQGLEIQFKGTDWSAEVAQSSLVSTEALSSSIVVRDTAGRTLEVPPSPETLAEALGDELTTLSHDLTLERVVRSLAAQ